MWTSIKLVVLLSAVGAVFAQHDVVEENDQIETLNLRHIIEKRAAGRDQSRIYGSNGPNDRLLHYENVNVKSGVLQVKKKDITFPPSLTGNPYTITCIKILDELRTGKNAEFNVSSGGVGSKIAIINMKSKRGEPIKYIVQIYGR